MAKLAIDRDSIGFGKKSGDFNSKSGDREILIILSKIGRSPEKSGDLEALTLLSGASLTSLELRPEPRPEGEAQARAAGASFFRIPFVG